MDRTRRLRQTAVMRSMVRENHVRTEELIYPLFVMEGENIVQPVESMPGICQYSVDRMNEELDRVKALQIPAILIFGIPEHKDEVGSGAYDEHGIVQTAIRRIKKDYPDLLVIADVCLCEYTSHGHCGLIRDGIILNDETLPLLAQTAVSYARAGADIIAPSAAAVWQPESTRSMPISPKVMFRRITWTTPQKMPTASSGRICF